MILFLISPQQLNQPLETILILETIRYEFTVTKIAEPIAAIHRKDLVLCDHEHVDNYSGKALITISFKDY